MVSKLIVGAVAFGLLLGCGADATRRSSLFAWHWYTTGRGKFCGPLAISPAAQQQGLQDVTNPLPLVFVFSRATKPVFWMKNTREPVTGAWVGSNRRVLGYWYGVPFSTSHIPAPEPVSYVIEYPASWSRDVPRLGSVLAIHGQCRDRDKA